jgi:hypothetical protein
VDVRLVPQLQELEVDGEPGRLADLRARHRLPQMPTEEGVDVVGRHLPQRPAEPFPQFLDRGYVGSDRGVGNPR